MAHDGNTGRRQPPTPGNQSQPVPGGLAGSDLARICEQFHQAFGPVPVGIAAISLTGRQPDRYLTVNDAYCELMGCSREELIGGDFLGDIHPEEQALIEDLAGKAVSGGIARLQVHMRLVRKDGEIVSVRLTGSAIQPPAGERYLAAFAADVTASAQAEAETRRLEHELRRLRRLNSIGQLMDGMVQDFSNTLTVIANLASLVRDEITMAKTTENATRWDPVCRDAQQIEDSAERAKRLIRQLHAFARREQAQPGLVDARQLVSDITGLLSEVLGERIRIESQSAAGLWPVEADSALIEQAIIDIALNARDAMPADGQLTIETANVDTLAAAAGTGHPGEDNQAGLADLAPGRYVEIRVTDTGTGMDAQTARRAFEPFFTTKPTDQAAGLGLPTVGRIAAQAGGKAWLLSQPGTGTTITLLLPAAPESTALAAAGEPYAGPVREHTAAILVVDDEAGIREVVDRVLTTAGYQVTTAADGQQALRLLADPAAAPDLLLTDVVMPGITGPEFAARAQALRPGLIVLYMSGHGVPAQGWPKPAPVIAKPFSRAALLARVSDALAAGTSTG